MSPHPWSRKLWLICILTICVSSCRTPGLRQPLMSNTVISPPRAGEEQILVDEGESSQPAFSPNGERLLFVSARRKGHALEQIYEKNLNSGEERRVTFQSGQTFQPSYHPKQNVIIYTSSTDELREQPPRYIPDPTPSKVPSEYQSLTEVYVHDLGALDIQRVTQHEGFDGEPRFHRDGTLTYTRALSNRLEVVSLRLHAGSATALKRLGQNSSSYVTSAEDNSSAWLNWDSDFRTAVLKIQRGREKPEDTAIDPAAAKKDLKFSPDGEWLLWSHGDSKGRFSIWIMDIKTLCPRPLLTDETSSLRHPALSPDMKTIAYTRIKEGRSRIAWRIFAPPTGPCASPH
jgi:dipeptidyl aminopeptidase/acylaminoacyl peptidase